MAEPDSQPCEAGSTSQTFLVDRFNQLLQVLLAERDALLHPAQSGLADLLARKEALCAEIAPHQAALLASLAPATVLPDTMGELRTLAERCRNENALNGRIAVRARHTTRTLLAVLTGETPGQVYGRRGTEQAASAGGHRLGSA